MQARLSKEEVIKRLTGNGISIVSWIGEYVSARKSHIVIECEKHGVIPTTHLHVLLNRKASPCKECTKENPTRRDTTKSIEKSISKFMATNKFEIGTKFKRLEKRDTRGFLGYWNIFCPVCANDTYSNAGLCTGNFEAHASLLSSSTGMPCRCRRARPIHTDEQWLYKIRMEVEKKKGITFVDVVKTGAWSSSIVYMHCVDHGNFESVYYNMFAGTGCPGCAKTGYDQTKPAYFYVLKIDGVSSSFTGYGISNSLASRLARHKAVLAREGLSIIDEKVVPSDGKNILDIERAVKSNFPLSSQPIKGFVKEATEFHLFDEVFKFANAMAAHKNNLVVV